LFDNVVYVMNGRMESGLLPSRKAASLLGVHPETLRRWHKIGKIKAIVTSSGNRLYDVSQFIDKEKKNNAFKICYCRVSSKKQSDDLDRQVKFMQKQFPDYKIVKDIGSALNWKRQGLRFILEQSMQGNVTEVVVAHKDRLSRISFELIEFILEKNGVKLVVLDKEGMSSETELAQDIMSIITVFSCKQNGKRRYSIKNTEN